MEDKVHPGHTPYGEIQGYANGVPAYSNLHDGHFSGIRNIDDNNKIMTGFRYQCVEFARRWLLERKGLYLTDVNWAASVFERDFVEDIKDGSKVRMVAVPNDGKNKPVTDSFLIYPRLMGVADWGHIAVITEVSDTFCRIADQNQHFHKWEGSHYSAELHFVEEVGPDGEALRFLEDKLGGSEWRPLGWMIFPDTPNRDPSVPLQWADKYVPPETDIVRIARCSKPVMAEEAAKDWLNSENPAEKAFVERNGTGLGRTLKNEGGTNQISYYVCNDEFMMRFYIATNEMHRAFIKTTARVIASDALLRDFGVPEGLWPIVRKSWNTQPHSIGSRLNFAVDDDDNVKCLSYDADVSSSLLECGRIQGKLSAHFGLASDGSWGSGWDIETKLVCAWRRVREHIKKAENADGKPLIHFFIRDNDQDHYTSLYVVEMAEKVGIETKLCTSLDFFHFGDGGRIFDRDGKAVTVVWKSWPWETVLSDFAVAKKERAPDWEPTSLDRVRLCDLLLNPDVYVFEPLWKFITSHKALLPFVFESYHETSPFVLPSARNPDREASLQDELVEKTSVFLEDQEIGTNKIVQKKLAMLAREGFRTSFGSWVIGGESAGISVLEESDDKSDASIAILRMSFDAKMVKDLEMNNKSKLKDDGPSISVANC